MVDRYFEWLVGQLGASEVRTHHFLLSRLFKKDFYYSIFQDKNRHGDGVFLRSVYAREEKIDLNELERRLGNCRVLEMIFALAQRRIPSFSYVKPGVTWEEFFWIMIENLGLKKFTDDFVGERSDPVGEIDDILTVFLDRKYDKNGQNGGLFPLQKVLQNTRFFEVWEQARLWIEEQDPKNAQNP